MKIYAPSYYNQFHCIAEKCKHNCCIGWEIDIDEESLALYLDCMGPIGEKLKKNISLRADNTPICDDSDSLDSKASAEIEPLKALAPVKPVLEDPADAHFILKEDERCPFLNNQNLCELMIELGGESLCQICEDHPRYRNFWSDRTEIGLGLACEEAARIILSYPDVVKLECIGTDNEPETEPMQDEKDIFDLREDLFAILQNRSKPTDARMFELMDFCGIKKTDYVFGDFVPDDIACEQLAVYLLYRHFADCIYDGRQMDRIRFVADSYFAVRNQWAAGKLTKTEDLAEIARAFSQKIEYDTDTWGDSMNW